MRTHLSFEPERNGEKYCSCGCGCTLVKHVWIDGREFSLLRWNEELRHSQAKKDVT